MATDQWKLEKTVKRPKTKHGNKIESHVDDAGAATAQDDSVPPSIKPHTDSEIERSLSIPPVAIVRSPKAPPLPLHMEQMDFESIDLTDLALGLQVLS